MAPAVLQRQGIPVGSMFKVVLKAVTITGLVGEAVARVREVGILVMPPVVSAGSTVLLSLAVGVVVGKGRMGVGKGRVKGLMGARGRTRRRLGKGGWGEGY